MNKQLEHINNLINTIEYCDDQIRLNTTIDKLFKEKNINCINKENKLKNKLKYKKRVKNF